MFITKKHLNNLGYQILGVERGGYYSLNHYVKYFHDQKSIVIFSTIHENKILIFKFSNDEYDEFMSGKIALSINGVGYGKTYNGYLIKNIIPIVIFNGGIITRVNKLKDMLEEAEKLVLK